MNIANNSMEFRGERGGREGGRERKKNRYYCYTKL
jgi:hypothetical protein